MITTPKAPLRAYTQEDLEKAILAVEGGMTVTAASKQFMIPRQTLKDKISGKSAVECKLGRPTIFTPDEEKILCEWIVAIGAAGFPITKDQIMASVEKLMTSLKRANPFAKSDPSKAALGDRWFTLFLKRHPEISARVSHSLTLSRANLTENNIKFWFEKVKKYVTSKNLESVFKDGQRVFNCDEIAFFLCPKEKKVYVKKGERHAYNITGNDEKECLTVLVTANAAGDLPPPMVVYSYERVPKHVVQKVPDTWGIGKSESGWMTAETFYEYITNIFHPWLTANNIPLPIVLFVDGYSSHLTLQLSEFCTEKQIELISLYPNAKHILQPMDEAIFHPLKPNWRKTVQQWRAENGSAKIKKEDFAPLLKSVFQTSLKPETIKNGFASTGLSSFWGFFEADEREKTCSYSYSQWNVLRDHVAYLESKIGQERLNRFKKNSFTCEETSLFAIWKAAIEEVLSYREAMKKQQKETQHQSDQIEEDVHTQGTTSQASSVLDETEMELDEIEMELDTDQ